MSTETPEFRLSGPIPSGTSVLQASAGTGKTWTIVALVTRLIAEQDVKITDLLIMTFTRIATAELRGRVRGGISGLIRDLSGLVEGRLRLEKMSDLTFYHATGSIREEHPGAPLLPNPDLVLKIDRLRAGLIDFDSTTIVTIHEFCSLALRRLGAGYDTSGFTFVEDPDQIQDEVIKDVYLRTHMFADAFQFTLKDIKVLAKKALSSPSLALHPRDGADGDDATSARWNFLTEIRTEYEDRKQALGIKTYDDLLLSLAKIVDPDDGPREQAERARAMLRGYWSHVLVDEFQDTDEVQWRIFEAIFHGHANLTLIGDPKQAIYGFRGGDIDTYLAARREAAEILTLAHNYRADEALLTSLNEFLEGAELGNEEITVEPVKAGKKKPSVRFASGEEPARLRLRIVDSAPLPLDRWGKRPLVPGVRDAIAADLVADIASLLAAEHEIRETKDGVDRWRPVAASDIAVLCHSNNEAQRYRSDLVKAGIHAVVNRGENVFTSDTVIDWLMLLEAIDRPRDLRVVKAAALTPFFGHVESDLLTDPETVVEHVSGRLIELGHVLIGGGPAALLENIQNAGDGEFMLRILRHPDGERRLTDLKHIGELIHEHVPGGGAAMMGAWLRDQRSEIAREQHERRLESDESAVQLYTIHSAKGLEFPFVYLPSVATAGFSNDKPYVAHDEKGRVLSVDHSGVIKRALEKETMAEKLRLVYVALTRGVAQVTTYAADVQTPQKKAWYQILMRDAEVLDKDTSIEDVIDEVAKRWGEYVSVEMIREREVVDIPRPPLGRMGSARAWTRTIDRSWRRTSYTSLSSGGECADGTEFKETPEELADTVSTDIPSAGNGTRETGESRVPSPMADLPKGARFGSLVHSVLENIDFRTVTDEEITEVVQEQLQYWPQDLDPEVLAGAIRAVITTPLKPALDLTLEGLDPAQRLNELEFELPLDGGQWASGSDRVTVRDIAPLLREHLDPSDPLYRYADAIDTPGYEAQALRGYLTGSIDLVFREGDKFYVADYKTNWLGPSEEPNTTATYAKDDLERAMEGSSYPLQALIYTVALHRYLTWRLPGYDPDQHIGGVLYLYVRGMAGEETPVIDGHATGVFSWHPQTALIIAISNLFEGKGAQQ